MTRSVLKNIIHAITRFLEVRVVFFPTLDDIIEQIPVSLQKTIVNKFCFLSEVTGKTKAAANQT